MSKEELQHIYRYYCERSVDVACLLDGIVELNSLLAKAFGVWIRITRVDGSYLKKGDSSYLYWIMDTTDNSCIATNADWYVRSDRSLDKCIGEMYKRLSGFSFARGRNTITLPRFRTNRELMMKLELAGFRSSVK